MESRTVYEEQILKDIQELPENTQRKLAKFIRFFKNEFIEDKELPMDEIRRTEEFLSVCGTWEDERSVEEQIHDIYSTRKSREATEEIF